jgi:hypothetical protein
MPNQPHATTPRRSAGTFDPRVPNEARASTGKGMPYRVPACATSTMGTQTIRLPSMIVPTACFQSMPADTRLAASM